MTWWQLCKRAWAVWKLRKVKFVFCIKCNVPLTVEETKKYYASWCCESCSEGAQAHQSSQYPFHGSWAHQIAPGLGGALGGLETGYSAGHVMALKLQQQQSAVNELLNRQQYLAQQQQQMNTNYERKRLLALLQGQDPNARH